jgi:hypothetical protein
MKKQLLFRNRRSPLSNRGLNIVSLIALLIACLASGSALAQQRDNNDGPFFGSKAKGKWIIGVKAAKVDNNIEELEDADAIGVVVGYEFDRPISTWGGSATVELEYIDAEETNLAGIGTYDPDMVNLFFTYRSAGDLYYKVKLGLSYSDIEFVTPGFDGGTEDVALAAGLGIGYHVGDYGSVELEYSTDSGDNDLGVLGLNALLEF